MASHNFVNALMMVSVGVTVGCVMCLVFVLEEDRVG